MKDMTPCPTTRARAKSIDGPADYGWVLHQNDEDEKAGIRECRRFIEDNFGMKIAQGTSTNT
jgi:hypothetical protein